MEDDEHLFPSVCRFVAAGPCLGGFSSDGSLSCLISPSPSPFFPLRVCLYRYCKTDFGVGPFVSGICLGPLLYRHLRHLWTRIIFLIRRDSPMARFS